MRRRLVRCALSTAIAVTTGIALASPAAAGPPRRQACVGTTFAGGAHESEPPAETVGATIRVFARDKVQSPPGLGDGIQLMQLGLLSDAVADNTCND